MNLFNEAIYKNHLEHTAEGTKWGKHKYLYITPSGRYVYPEDVANGRSQSDFRRQQINDQIKSAHQGVVARGKANIARSRQINDQIKSAHQGDTSRNADDMRKAKELSDMSGMKLSATHKLNRLAKEKGTDSKEFKEELKILSEGDKEQEKKMLDVINGKNSTAKTSGAAAGSKVVSTKTEEQKKMGLSDDDVKKMKINTQATEREDVLRNIALKTIRGDYGNGADRKAKLGNYYDEVQKRVSEIVKEGSEIKKEEPKQNNSSKPASKSSNENGSASSKKEYKMEEYKKGDKDFDDENYEKATRLGNTDFHTFKRDDGKYVILEEDMKWVVDEKPSSKMIKNLEAFEDYTQRARKNNVRYASKDWERMASEAINGRDFTNVDTGKNSTTKAYQDQTRKYRTEDQIRSAHQGATKEKKGVLYTRKNNGKYTGKRIKVKHYDLTEDGNYLMHWGKKRRSGRYQFGSGDRPYQHEPKKVARNHSWSDRRTMSIKDLDYALNRARKELDLYNAERNNRSAGQKFVEEVLTSVGKSVLIGAATGGLKYAGKQFVTKNLENPELANAMFGGGGGGNGKKKKHKS